MTFWRRRGTSCFSTVPQTLRWCLARNLGRPGEEVAVTTLEALTASQADMLTLVLVGNSHTVAVQRGESLWVYTPRGYGNKEQPVGAPSADRKRSAG